MQKILISQCLLGANVRYHAGNALIQHPLIQRWQREGRLVSVCPEVSGGAAVPRPPSEITARGGGQAVLAGQARVVNKLGEDMTACYMRGAHLALETAQQHHIKIAILKDHSPSCGSHFIYDGSFTGRKISGMGVTVALLRQNGITVFNEAELDAVEEWLRVNDSNYFVR